MSVNAHKMEIARGHKISPKGLDPQSGARVMQNREFSLTAAAVAIFLATR
jgi:hypothetical protein